MHMKEIHDPLLKEELRNVGQPTRAFRNGEVFAVPAEQAQQEPGNRHERRATAAKHRHAKQMRAKFVG